MRMQSKLATLAAIGTLTLAAQSQGATVDEIKYDSEVKSCVAEIRNHVSYADASRVLHEVYLVKPKLVGYVMKIDTSIYTDAADTPLREYATYCVVNGDHKPLKFEIREAIDRKS